MFFFYDVASVYRWKYKEEIWLSSAKVTADTYIENILPGLRLVTRHKRDMVQGRAEKLSRGIGNLIRHNNTKGFKIALTKDARANTQEVLAGLRYKGFIDVAEEELRVTHAVGALTRFDIIGDCIRANKGWSDEMGVEVLGEVFEPAEDTILYHRAYFKWEDAIKRAGLKRGKRAAVHFYRKLEIGSDQDESRTDCDIIILTKCDPTLYKYYVNSGDIVMCPGDAQHGIISKDLIVGVHNVHDGWTSWINSSDNQQSDNRDTKVEWWTQESLQSDYWNADNKWKSDDWYERGKWDGNDWCGNGKWQNNNWYGDRNWESNNWYSDRK